MKHGRDDYNADIQVPAAVIPAEEPVFLLRGQDRAAALTVRIWANLAELLGADPRVVANARRHADRMEAWPVKKVPDTPE